MDIKNQLITQNKDLWNRFLTGDDEAFVRLYELNVEALLYFGLHFTPLRDQVKDAIQEVFTNLYAKRDRLEPIKNVRFYLFVSLKNVLFAMYNKSSKHYQIDTIEPVFSMEPSAEDTYIQDEQESELKQHIHKMLQTLSPRQREVIYYRFTEELSYEEICLLMKMNIQSVRNLQHRSFQKIREMYLEYDKIRMLNFKNKLSK